MESKLSQFVIIYFYSLNEYSSFELCSGLAEFTCFLTNLHGVLSYALKVEFDCDFVRIGIIHFGW